MTEKIMQCCYTNAVKETGGKISSGWQAVVVSEHIPAEAYANCVSLQNANSTIQSHMVDERGNVLNLLEITGDGAYVYVSRTQYGLTDRLGRPNMFSHAYIFPWKQEGILSDPNVFLTLTADNFAKDEEAAARPKEALARTAPFTLERALERSGLTEETYLTLIRCVYARFMERKAAKPVFVQYDGSEEQMQAILYCVYRGLPFCVRRSLSIASSASNTTKKHHLVFSTAAAGHESYLAPQTGENNVLTPRTLRRIARYGFVDYAVQNCREDMEGYFRRLEELAMELGDSAASDELVLKIAHQLLPNPSVEGMSDEELGGSLSDALRSRGYGSQRMEEYIGAMLREVCRRRISLTEESVANLDQWLASPASADLADAGEQYNIYIISTLTAPDAARRLNSLPKPVFERYRQALEQSEGGLKILDCYYAGYGLAGKEITWQALGDLLAEANYVRGAVMVEERVDKEAWRLYEAQLDQPGQAVSGYKSLMGLMRALLPQDRIAACDETARERYWDKVTLETFSVNLCNEYAEMRSTGARCRLFADFYKVLRTYMSPQPSRDDAFLQMLSWFSNQYEEIFNNPKEADAYVKKVEQELCLYDPQAEKLSGWIDAAAIPDAKNSLDDILALRAQLQQQDYAALADTFQHMAESGLGPNGDRLMRIVGETVAEECRAKDIPERCVPLDVWLVLGRALCPENAFQIFDEMDPCVLRDDGEQVAGRSRLLETAPYVDQAEDYVQSKGKCAKAVHKWLNELKAAGRRRRAEERKQRKEADGSVLDRGRALFSQFTSGGGEAKPGRRLQEREAPQKEAPPKGRGGFFGQRRAAGQEPKRDSEERKDGWRWPDDE